MKFCLYCGASLVDGAAFYCAECGKALPKSSSEKEEIRPPQASPDQQENNIQKHPPKDTFHKRNNHPVDASKGSPATKEAKDAVRTRKKPSKSTGGRSVRVKSSSIFQYNSL